MVSKVQTYRKRTKLKNPALLGRATIGNNEWTLGASWLDDRTGMVPWWFKNDAQGSSHAAAADVIRALRYWGYKAQIKKDMYPLIEVEKKDLDGTLGGLDKDERRRTMELMKKLRKTR